MTNTRQRYGTAMRYTITDVDGEPVHADQLQHADHDDTGAVRGCGPYYIGMALISRGMYLTSVQPCNYDLPDCALPKLPKGSSSGAW